MKAPFFYVFLITLVSACTPKPEFTDEPVLTIGESAYSVKDFSKDLALRLSQLNLLSSKNPSVIQVFKNRLLSDFIIKHLIAEDLKTQQIEVSQEEIQAAFEQIKSQYQDDYAFKEELIQSNATEKSLKAQIKSELMIKKFFAQIQLQITPPTDPECLEFYNRNKGEYYVPQRIYVRQIVVKERHQADDLLDTLKKQKSTDFSELAKQYSIGPESAQGGLIGWVEEGQISIFDSAFKLKPGQLSQVTESAFGFHLIRVEKKEAKKQLKFDEVKDKIFKILLAEQEQGLFLKWLDEKLRKAKIKKNDALLKALIVETRGSQ